jgi:hypothetical protein
VTSKTRSMVRRPIWLATGIALAGTATWLIVADVSRSGGADHAQSREAANAVAVARSQPPAATGVQAPRVEPKAFSRPARPADTPLRPTGLLSSDARRVVTAVVAGRERSVYVGRESNAMTCLILQDSINGGGGCNHSADAFAGSAVWWSSVHSNSPSQELTIFGVAAERVNRVQLRWKTGDQTVLPLSPDQGFVHVITKDEILPADVPDRLVAFDSQGRVLESITLGIRFGG